MFQLLNAAGQRAHYIVSVTVGFMSSLASSTLRELSVIAAIFSADVSVRLSEVDTPQMYDSAKRICGERAFLRKK